MPEPEPRDKLLTPGEVAQMFRVDPKTVGRWATEGRIGYMKTPGGQRRYKESEVKQLFADLTQEADPKAKKPRGRS